MLKSKLILTPGKFNTYMNEKVLPVVEEHLTTSSTFCYKGINCSTVKIKTPFS